jgi:hypothetical protein
MSNGAGGILHRGPIANQALLETNCKGFTEFNDVNYKLDRSSGQFKVLNDIRAQGLACNIHQGDQLMSLANDIVDRDQQPRVFVHTGAVPLETTSTDKRVIRREFWKNVRLMGFARSAVTYDPATNKPRGSGQLASVFGGVLSVMNSGNEMIRARDWVVAQLPDRADTKRARHTLQTVGVSPRNIPRLLDEIDLTHLLGTKVFKDAVRDAVMFVHRIRASIEAAQDAGFTGRTTNATTSYPSADVDDKSIMYPEYTKGELQTIANIFVTGNPPTPPQVSLCNSFASKCALYPDKDAGGNDKTLSAPWQALEKVVVDAFAARLKASAETPEEKEATAFLVGNVPFSAAAMACVFSRVEGIALEDGPAGFQFDINASCPHGGMMRQLTGI